MRIYSVLPAVALVLFWFVVMALVPWGYVAVFVVMFAVWCLAIAGKGEWDARQADKRWRQFR